MKVSQSSSKSLKRDFKFSLGSMLSSMAPSPLPLHFPKMSSDSPKASSYLHSRGRGACVLCAAFWAFAVPWSRCFITLLSGHQPLCSLGSRQWSPPIPRCLPSNHYAWLRMDTGTVPLCSPLIPRCLPSNHYPWLRVDAGTVLLCSPPIPRCLPTNHYAWLRVDTGTVPLCPPNPDPRTPPAHQDSDHFCSLRAFLDFPPSLHRLQELSYNHLSVYCLCPLILFPCLVTCDRT